MPCDYRKYPKNWKTEIRPAILQRAGHRCEKCGVWNNSWGYRDETGKFCLQNKRVFKEAGHIRPPFDVACSDGRTLHIIEIVLTVAHLHDPDPMNCDPSNLAALCQRCHNQLDAKMRQENARKTRLRGQLQLTLDQ